MITSIMTRLRQNNNTTREGYEKVREKVQKVVNKFRIEIENINVLVDLDCAFELLTIQMIYKFIGHTFFFNFSTRRP